jgi:hypothetical protein
VKVDPVGRGPGRWTARAVQVRDEDGRKGAFPPPGREMRKKKIPISQFGFGGELFPKFEIADGDHLGQFFNNLVRKPFSFYLE